MSTTTLQHPSIGTILGNEGNGVYQFLGLQYAVLRDRLAESQVKSTYQTPVNATNYGPSSFSPPTGFDNEMGFIQQALPKPEMVHSDIDCLNLNITVPSAQNGIPSERKLPVFIWMHGGGFVVGANSWPHYDHAKVVKLASDHGVPVIGVGVNFRLGLPGLLTSDELRQHGYKSNNVLRDQRNAFKWVKQYISGFGGDPENITVIGESTGAVATTLHLYSKEPLFNRAIATGGSCLLVPPFSPQDHESVYQKVLAVLGSEDLGPEERIQKLLSIPMDEIIAKLPPYITFLPMVDGDIIPCRPTFAAVSDPADESMPGKQWCEGLTIGDSQFDASTFGFMMAHLKPNIRQKFSASIRSSLSSTPHIAESLLELYDFKAIALLDPRDDDEIAFFNFLKFCTDIGYYAATTSFARGWPSSNSKIFTFFFNEPNPWPGVYQGLATHVLDVVFLFQNYNDKLPPSQEAAAKEFALDLMRFVSGKDPWEENIVSQRKAKVFGPSTGDGRSVSRIIDNAESEASGRRIAILDLGNEVGFDVLAEALRRFQMGQ
ncbi:uncharacterized protein Z518_07467 [Rhinocladiella mackenziei CBS 650.93]|uniref:Carboxylic ester hydrolase n=1 Tax=Rhinocladiella mackenziei CBS 650.93 TaxID=1442369 RepID=A0A0D2IDM1_9EURO|nr:uncharacterized protein Z518_07467 [Rhinocladiella mackenziei CBS 650.93]KIX03914.1 hypothetical protein Z518_07467 [Rhinocladiella mackenziei CBS 650.93]